ncbi:MAG: type II toxin-antitoxin system RelE/ParE family toxin [Gammaproteobacteria bacterium]|nr:type II toxin-antitoxin system RelE/ParE family toxin [Gammaproteobacteria bacterium]
MAYEVLLTDAAARDLDELYDYIARHDSQERAGYVLEQIETAVMALAELPERGTHPKELQSLGSREYREVFFKPYRILYRIAGTKVFVYLVADGRRDMQALLSRRLLNG